MEGKIVRWLDHKGYGFIDVPKSEDDVFFHVFDFLDRTAEPREGDTVEFELKQTGRGPRAMNIKIIE